MTDPRYLTPDERRPTRYMGGHRDPEFDRLLASHAAADERIAALETMNGRLRAALYCLWDVRHRPGACDDECPCNVVPCPACTVARECDEMNGAKA